jgi:beta-lactam-binding protein with PASTA domain
MDMMNFVKGFAVAQFQGVPQSSAVKYGAIGALTTGMMSIVLPFILAKQEADDIASQSAAATTGTTGASSTPAAAQVTVPDVVNKTVTQAFHDIEHVGLVPAISGVVIGKQTPTAGSTAATGTGVKLETKADPNSTVQNPDIQPPATA